MALSIMCFSWNAAGLRICETMSQLKADQARTSYLTRKPKCVAPDFFENIRDVIRTRRPGLVVMVTEDEDSSGTYFHSDLLPASMPEIGYALLKRSVLDGVGEQPSGVKYTGLITGDASGSSLRVSIYAINDMVASFKLEEKRLRGFFTDGVKQEIIKQNERIAGAIASYVWHPQYGKFVFIATHLPAGTMALKINKGLDYATYRSAVRSANNICLINILTDFVEAVPVEAKPDHVFILGDLNYDIVVPNKKAADIVRDLSANLNMAKIQELHTFDELHKALTDVPLLGFQEGIGGKGPLFMPTWRLARGRTDSCIPTDASTRVDVTCFAEGGIGWHDRIIYKERLTSNYMANCVEYNRLDVGNMHGSTHAGVTALFEIKSL
jgi:hypothetical protein